MNILELDNISKIYHRGGWFGRGSSINALVDINIAVAEGKSVGVIGRSAALIC
ncbi:MAG: hypothetical protein HQK72_08370 [Desulfamplus sp.]|nr:hypothetical protein [Desulfamplus sp.]